MKLTILNESGYKEALLGMALSYYPGGTSLDVWYTALAEAKAIKRSKLLAFKQGGHNKFLESIQVWLHIKASRAFWQEFDTYRVGVSKQSASTMHTLARRELSSDDFLPGTAEGSIAILNSLREFKDINLIKANLPEGFLQDRVVNLNYRTLQNIICQRQGHRLEEWGMFISKIQAQIQHPEYLFQPEIKL